MAPEIQKYYEAYFDLFSSEGWKQFVEDVNDSAGAFNVRSIGDEASLKFVQGQLAVMDKVINWQAAIEAMYADLEANAGVEESE